VISAPRGARVRVSPLPPAFDLMAACDEDAAVRFLFERDGVGVAVGSPGEGSSSSETATAEGIRALGDEAVAALRALGSAPTAPAPVAVGQFPFDPDGTAWLHIPWRLVRRTERDRTWLIDIVPPGCEPEPLRPTRATGSVPANEFGRAQVREHPSAEGYAKAVQEAVRRIHAAEVRKVVLARTVEVAAGRSLDPLRLAHRLRAVDPLAYTFVTPVAAASEHFTPLLVGASPELLVSRRGREVRSTPLAGSAPRAGDRDEDRANGEGLRASAKNREEHAIVVEAIAETLGPQCDDLHWDPEPVLLETANVWHLATRFKGVLRDPAPTAVDLVAALHPTPAVCGIPVESARSLIDELEPFGRGGYAGPVGWVDANGDGEWAIALRCAELHGEHATLYAGAGIVAASDPADEVDETDRKFRAFLDSLRWG
jgi:isochorismate synthase